MTCRCLTPQMHADRLLADAARSAQHREQVDAARIRELEGRTPNPDEFSVEDVEQVGHNLVIKVRYPGCARCDFDRCKVMVYLGAQLQDAILWRRIDPHFRAPLTTMQLTGKPLREAPSPAARFPASAEGWADALAYAKRKEPQK